MNLAPALINAGRVLQLSDQWRQDAHLVDMDRAELSRHYNGGALDGGHDDDQAGKPTMRRANMLLGYKFLSRPIEQLTAVYDDGPGFIDAKVNNPNLPANRRRIVEGHLNTGINLVVQQSERMYWPWRANIGDATINGMGCLYRDDAYDWAPKYGRPYFAWDAPADITNDKFTDWCFLGDLTLSDILARLDRLKKVDDSDSEWDRAKLAEMAESIAKRHLPTHASYQPLQYEDPVTWQEWVQTQSWGAAALLSSCPVVWFFAKRFDKEYRRPIDMYCVPRWGEQCDERDGKLRIQRPAASSTTGVLFYKSEAFEDVRKCFFPFLLSCMVGGEPLMRRTMGLGALMYDLDIRVQSSVNNMFDAQDFDFSPLFQASDQQSEMELQELAGARIRPYDIMPAGAKFMEKPKGNRPYSSVFELTQLMSNEMGNQAQAYHGGEGFENKGRGELEVQVLERRQQLATALRLRMGDFIRRGDPLVSMIGEVLVNEKSLLQCDKAWPERQALKAYLKDCGVEWDEVAGQCTFAMRRSPGHGDPGLALYRAQQTEVIARGLGPEAHRVAQRNLVAAVNGGDTKFAEEMVPSQEQDAGRQEQDALNQSSLCLTTFVPVPPAKTDNAMAHVPVHMAVLTSHIAMAREAGNVWTRAAQRGWEALAAHTMLDVRTLGAFNQQMAKDADKAIKKMIGEAAQFEISSLPGPVDPVEQAKLQMAQREQQRKEIKTKDDIEHRLRTQEHREEATAFQQNLQMGQLVENERTGQVARATSLAKTASDIAQPPASPTPA
jgi:hypothetical protein